MGEIQWEAWRGGIWDDLFIDSIRISVLFASGKKHHSLCTSKHCYKTGDEMAEMQAAIDQTVAEFESGTEYEEITAEMHGGMIVLQQIGKKRGKK